MKSSSCSTKTSATHEADAERRAPRRSAASGARRDAPGTTSCRRPTTRRRRDRRRTARVFRERKRGPCECDGLRIAGRRVSRRVTPRGVVSPRARRRRRSASSARLDDGVSTTGVSTARGPVGVSAGAGVVGALRRLALFLDAHFFFERVAQLVRRALELAQALAERSPELGQLARPEDDQRNDEDDDQFGHAQ